MPPRRVDPKSVAPDSVLARLYADRGLGARRPVTIEYDDRRVPAREGEPLAVALLAAGFDTLARSVKFHRPRGPACLRAACDGCLTRIDGVPNAMACRVAARDGARVHSQNAFPSARLDVLRVTDWFFPKHFDHHRLMVRYGPAINRTMQVFARRMAGLGTLPDADGPVPAPEEIDCDVLVAGAGPAGLAAAIELAQGGARVVLADEDAQAGGTLRDELELLPGPARVTGPALADALLALARAAGVDVRLDASATATFDNATVVATPARALLVRARARLFANGGFETLGAFENNDLPGVYTARAAARALLHGVLVGQRVCVVGGAWPARGLVAALRAAGAEVEWVEGGAPVAALGRGSVGGARVRDAGGAERKVACDALAVALEEAPPSYEPLGQSGVEIEPDGARQCFVPRVAPDGGTERADVFAAGGVRGRPLPIARVDLARPLECDGPVADGRRVAGAVRAFLRGERAVAAGAPKGASP